MTFAEAKDKLALKHYNAPFKDVHFYEHKWKICEEAGLILEQHAASVREEGRNNGWEQGWKDGYDQCQSDQKITAPGR